LIRVFDVTSGKETRNILVSSNGMAGMALSPDATKLVALPCVPRATRASGFSEKPDESVKLLEVETGKHLGELLIPYVSKRFLKIGPDNKTLFAEEQGGRMGIWNLATEREERS